MQYILIFILILLFRTPCMANFDPIQFTNQTYFFNSESCEQVNINADYQLLKDSSIYGEIVNSIFMKSYASDGLCNPNIADNQPKEYIEFCAKQIGAEPCNIIRLKLNSASTLQNIFPSLPIGKNPLTRDIKIKAEIIKSRICATLYTPYNTTPLVCRQYIDPIEKNNSIKNASKCEKVSGSCYDKGKNSKFWPSFSGSVMQCLRESLFSTLFSSLSCNTERVGNSLSTFFSFQQSVRIIVLVLLTLSIIFHAINIILEPSNISAGEEFAFWLKIVLVIYFVFGMTIYFFDKDWSIRTTNGMVDLILPLLLDFTDTMANIVFSSAGADSKLCYFKPSDYGPKYGFYSLWDGIDCRLMTMLIGVFKVGTVAGIKAGVGSVLPFLNLVLLLLLGGEILLFLFLMTLLLIFATITIRFIITYIILIITIYVLVYVSPIFIPLVLFETTKTYFTNWFNLLLSCAIQPMIIMAFFSFGLVLVDNVYYKDCKFDRVENDNKIEFFLSDDQSEDCKASPGYIINRLFKGEGKVMKTFLFFSYEVYKDIFNLKSEIIAILIVLYLLTFMFNKVNQFAAGLSGGMTITIGQDINLMPDKDKAKDAASGEKGEGDKEKNKNGSGDKEMNKGGGGKSGDKEMQGSGGKGGNSIKRS